LIKAAEDKRQQRQAVDEVRRQRIRAAIEQKRIKAQANPAPPDPAASTEGPPA
jgi:hypothetical protein